MRFAEFAAEPKGSSMHELEEKQARTVDETEVGKRVSGQNRFALEVPDLDAASGAPIKCAYS